MNHAAFITIVEREGAMSREEAERATRATLETLGDRLSGGEARDVAEQLPADLQPLLEDGEKAQPFDAEEFVRRVAEREGTQPGVAARHVRAVFAALGAALSAEELHDMVSELPKDFAPFVEAAEAQQRVRDSAPFALISAEAFYGRVALRAGVDPNRARQATEATLQALADRISGGEVEDLERELPPELHAPLERGKAETDGRARKMSLDEYLRLVAEREGATPDEAEDHARAVFATLRETIDDKEFSDVVAQLPDEYSVLLARP